MEEINMKKLVILGLVAVMLLPLLAIGCGNGSTIEITLDDFTTQISMVKNVTLNAQDTLTVKLGSNPSTGFGWEDAVIGNGVIIQQTSRNFIAATSGLAGAPGTDVWVFTAKSAGTTTISIQYDRSWETLPPTYTLTINVTVK